MCRKAQKMLKSFPAPPLIASLEASSTGFDLADGDLGGGAKRVVPMWLSGRRRSATW